MPELNRRNALIGLGGLAIGGGALLGSGAFSTVEAERDVEVNVLVDDEIGDSDQFADVLVDVGAFNSVAVTEDGIGGDIADETTLFPTEDVYTDTGAGGFGDGYVSLLQNDVTLVFGFDDDGDARGGQVGDDNRLLPNSSTTFEDLIAVVNTNDEPTEGFHELEFSEDFDGRDDTQVLFSDPDNGFSGGRGEEFGQVGATTAEERDIDVETGDGDDTRATGDLTITITPED